MEVDVDVDEHRPNPIARPSLHGTMPWPFASSPASLSASAPVPSSSPSRQWSHLTLRRWHRTQAAFLRPSGRGTHSSRPFMQREHYDEGD